MAAKVCQYILIIPRPFIPLTVLLSGSRWNVILELSRYLFDPHFVENTQKATTPRIRSISREKSESCGDVPMKEVEEVDVAMKKRLHHYLDGRTTLTEIFWNHPDIMESELVAFADRNNISVLYHYCGNV